MTCLECNGTGKNNCLKCSNSANRILKNNVCACDTENGYFDDNINLECR